MFRPFMELSSTLIFVNLREVNPGIRIPKSFLMTEALIEDEERKSFLNFKLIKLAIGNCEQNAYFIISDYRPVSDVVTL